MARFDLHVGDGVWLLHCQSNLLEGLNTRLVVPLLPAAEAPPPMRRLNPVFDVDNQTMVMATQFAATLRLRDMGPVRGSLAAHEATILNALDFLISGYCAGAATVRRRPMARVKMA